MLKLKRTYSLHLFDNKMPSNLTEYNLVLMSGFYEGAGDLGLVFILAE